VASDAAAGLLATFAVNPPHQWWDAATSMDTAEDVFGGLLAPVVNPPAQRRPAGAEVHHHP
jgi:hypothetical protein